MEHDIGLVKGAPDAVGIAQITPNQIDLSANVGRTLVEPAGFRSRVVTQERCRRGAEGYQMLGQVTPDEPTTPGNNYALAAPIVAGLYRHLCIAGIV